MKWLDNKKMVYKLSGLILIALLALLTVGYTGYYHLRQANTAVDMLYRERLVPIKLLNEMCSGANATNRAVLELMLTTDNKRNQELTDEIANSVKQNNEKMAMVAKLPLDTKAVELLEDVKKVQQDNRSVRGQVLELAKQNKNAEAYALYVAQGSSLTLEYIKRLTALADYFTQLSEKANADNDAMFAQASIVIIASILAAMVILGLCGWLINKSVTNPLRTMVNICKTLAGGDFRDKPRQVTRKDEIGQVADALVEMRCAVGLVLKQVNESAEQVAASSEELTASAEQSSQATNQVADSVNDVAQGAAQQVKAVDAASGVVEQMSAGIQQMAASAGEVSVVADKTTEAAREGGKAVEAAMLQMINIEQAVTGSASVVAKLGERSQEIGQIVDTISGIAGQTNLLALNAAIEAARAGEQGRGFAVVAEEVRKLAEQSQEAAKQIAQLILEIQSETDSAVTAMNHGTGEVKEGTEVVNRAGKAFNEIVSLIDEVSSQIRDISAAVQQMASGSQQIVTAVRDIDQISKETAGQTQTISAATEEQSASMEEIATSSQALAKLAETLQGVVRNFKV